MLTSTLFPRCSSFFSAAVSFPLTAYLISALITFLLSLKVACDVGGRLLVSSISNGMS